MKPSKAALIGVSDQGLSSAFNLLATVLVARVASDREFGAFGVLMTAYLLTITVGKGVTGGAVAINLARHNEADFRVGASRALGASFAFGLMVSACCLIAAAATSSTLRTMLVIGALTFPALTLQDTCRQLCYARGRPALAALSSLTWGACQVTLFGLLSLSAIVSPVWFATAWAVSSLGGIAIPIWRLSPSRRDFSARAWFKDHGSIVRNMTFDYLLIAMTVSGAPLIIGLIAGLESVGSLRGAITLFGPLTMINHGLYMAMLPLASRRWADGDRAFHHPLRNAGAVLAVSCAVWGLILNRLPDSIGREILGDTWPQTQRLLIVAGVWIGLGYAAEPAIAALRIVGRSGLVARFRIVLAPASIIGAAFGAGLAGVHGAVACLALATAVTALTFWSAFIRERRP